METFISSSKLDSLIIKYEKYIANIQWHIDTNKPNIEELDKCITRISDIKTVIDDLKTLTR